MPEPEAYALDSAGNALRIVDLLRTRRSLTVTQVSQELGVGKSTAHRLLSTLVAEGFALRDPVRRRYHPGRALMETGLAALAPFTGDRRHAQPLGQLAEHTGGSAKVLVLDGPFARVIQIADSDPDRRVGGSLGQLLHAHTTAGGKMLLSGEDPATLRSRLGGQLTASTERTITDWDAFLMELARIRERGWASNAGEASNGVYGLAVPVQTESGQMVAALCVAMPTSNFPAEQELDLLRHMFAAAYALSQSDAIKES